MHLHWWNRVGNIFGKNFLVQCLNFFLKSSILINRKFILQKCLPEIMSLALTKFHNDVPNEGMAAIDLQTLIENVLGNYFLCGKETVKELFFLLCFIKVYVQIRLLQDFRNYARTCFFVVTSIQ